MLRGHHHALRRRDRRRIGRARGLAAQEQGQGEGEFLHDSMIPRRAAMRNTSKLEESGSFLKKRTKKLLRTCTRSIRKGRSRNNQTFLLLFFKKEVLPSPG
jgi:hypothetical protein